MAQHPKPTKNSVKPESPKAQQGPIGSPPPAPTPSLGADLTDRLRNNPALVCDPNVRQEFSSLVSIAYGLHETEQAKARERLKQLIEAFAQGFLGPGWTLKSPPGKPGRKPITQEPAWLSCTVSEDYEHILGLLQQRREELKPAKTVIGKLESQERQARRILPILKEVWRESRFRYPHVPPDDAFLRWAKAEMKKRAISLDGLAYRFVAWYWTKLTEQPWNEIDTSSWGYEFTPSKVRHLVQEWRKIEKALHSGATF